MNGNDWDRDFRAIGWFFFKWGAILGVIIYLAMR